MENIIIKTGYLNYHIDTGKIQKFLNNHKGIETLFKDFKPKEHTRKAFMSAYKKFLSFKDKNEVVLLNYNFHAETISSENFGTKTFYKTNEAFFWSELFEYYWIFKN